MKSICKPLTTIQVVLLLLGLGNLKLQAQQREEDRKVSSFDHIMVEGSANTFVYVDYDKTPGITVKADERFIAKIKTTVSGGTLTIYFNSKQGEDIKVEVFVRMPVVKKVSISGGGNVEIIDGFDSNNLQTDIMRGGTLLFKKQADIHTFRGSVTAGGSIDALKLKIKKATVMVSGGGEVLLQVKDQLEGKIAGGGNIFYEGDPKVSSSVVGGGRIAMIN